MNILVASATGATGRWLVKQLLDRGHCVRAIVRSADKLPDAVRNHPHITLIHAPILDLDDDELIRHTQSCDAVVSCLGHNLSFKGMYGRPRRLVADAVRRLCDAIRANHPPKPVKFVLMNTAGYKNPELETIPVGETWVVGLIRLLLPPHGDNETAADYLRTKVGQDDDKIEWVVVRPDSLIDENTVSEYKVYESPIRSAIFNAGATSRINVGHFMADLITRDELWSRWQGCMPVIYNQESGE
ncbi:MAG: NAD(P)-binding oxidoreductase [candidate division KSB1 bacterium]|nr:NAD(P)-binding oxidoreductase [candidate division KSB1 bacterium]